MNIGTNKLPIVIIGAGMAGLGAGLTLTSNKNTNFFIFEAQNRPGGRILTLKVNNSIIELGAQWVHGTDTDLYNILQKHNLIHDQTSDEGLGLYVRDDGYVIDDYLVKKVDFQVGKILTECETFVDIVTNSSVGEFLTNKFQEFLTSEDCSEEDRTLMEELFDWHVRFQVIDNSCKDLNNLSLKEWGRYSCLGKDGQQHINIKGGYGALIDVLIKTLPENVVEYNKVVENIEILSSGDVLIKCEDGSLTYASSVIVTCSIGVLKGFKAMESLLSIRTKTLIENMGFDGMGKVFLEFDSKWWGNNVEGYQLIWRKDQNTCKKFPDWLRHLSGFEMVLDQPNMLMTWVGHFGVRKMEETEEETIGEQCVLLLRHFLKDDNVPLPIKVYKSSWLTNNHVKGAYSHSTVETDTELLPPGEILSKPIVDEHQVPKIYLAGEAIHESHFSTTHGAFESGQIQTRKLLGFLNKTTTN